MEKVATRTMVLGDEVNMEDIERGAIRKKWKLIKQHPATDDAPLELVYAVSSDKKTTISYVEDHFVMVRYLVIRGKELEKARRLVETTFDCYDDEEIIDNAENAKDAQAQVDWLMLVTVIGPQLEKPRFVKLIKKRLSSKEAPVRRAALIAVSWLEWPEFRADVEKLATDKVRDVREDAKRLVEAYRLRDAGKL
jgi:hypothetical protein